MNWGYFELDHFIITGGGRMERWSSSIPSGSWADVSRSSQPARWCSWSPAPSAWCTRRKWPLGCTGRMPTHTSCIIRCTLCRLVIFATRSTLLSSKDQGLRLRCLRSFLPLGWHLSGAPRSLHSSRESLSRGTSSPAKGTVSFWLTRPWQQCWVLCFRWSCKWPGWSWSQLRTWWGHPSWPMK